MSASEIPPPALKHVVGNDAALADEHGRAVMTYVDTHRPLIEVVRTMAEDSHSADMEVVGGIGEVVARRVILALRAARHRLAELHGAVRETLSDGTVVYIDNAPTLTLVNGALDAHKG